MAGPVTRRRTTSNFSTDWVPPGERTFGAYLRAIHSAPTFRVQTLAVFVFGLGVVIRSGVLVMLMWLGIGLAILVVLGYPLFRRRGRIG